MQDNLGLHHGENSYNIMLSFYDLQPLDFRSRTQSKGACDSC